MNKQNNNKFLQTSREKEYLHFKTVTFTLLSDEVIKHVLRDDPILQNNIAACESMVKKRYCKNNSVTNYASIKNQNILKKYKN